MNENSIVCLVGILLLLSPFLLATHDRHKRYPIVEVKELERKRIPNERIDGMPLPGTREAVIYQANHWQDLRPYTEGTTIAGARTRVVTRIGRNRYQISAVDWHTEPPRKPAGMSDERYIRHLQETGWTVRNSDDMEIIEGEVVDEHLLDVGRPLLQGKNKSLARR